MIRLGMTDCPVVRELLDKDLLHLDYLEVHGPYAKSARKAYPHIPMLLHNALYQWSLTHEDGLQHKNAAMVTRERIALTGTPWYSLHLGFSAAEVDFQDEAMVAISPLQPKELVLARCIERLQQLTQMTSVPVLIENLDYNPTQAYEYVCETNFIQNILAETDTGLLFDLAHARVTATAFGIPLQEYIDQLPLDKIRQIHLNSPGWRDGRLVDAHLELTEDDYQLLETILKRSQPWAITLEYNRNVQLACSQIGRLREIIQMFGTLP